jgi:DNA invertase Pin-like site-specific DNA recombinase
MKAAIYARESVSDTKNAPDIKEQISKCVEYCLNNNIEVAGIYKDNGFSGGNWNRPEYNNLLSASRGHRFHTVVVWSQDRIARDTEQFLSFYRQLRKNNITVHSLTEGFIDMESLGGRVQFTSLAMASEIFRLLTGEKVKRTYQGKKIEAEKKGTSVKWGRRRLEFDAAEALRLHNEGRSLRYIGNVFGVSPQTVMRLFQNTNRVLSTENNDKEQVPKNPIVE